MKRMSVLIAVVASLAIAGGAVAANPKLRTFGTGDTVVTGNSATIVNDAGEYGGVYLKSRSQSNKRLAAVSFAFTSVGDVAGGAPRFSWPIDTDRNGSVDGYAFVDVNGCGGGTGTWVSSENPDCLVYFHTEPTAYANWDAFAAAHPTWRSARGAIPFIIADVAGSYSITGISLR